MIIYLESDGYECYFVGEHHKNFAQYASVAFEEIPMFISNFKWIEVKSSCLLEYLTLNSKELSRSGDVRKLNLL